jgi:hypothetical protein
MTTADHFTLQVLPGELAPDLEELYSDYVNELTAFNPELPSLDDLLRMLKWCPISPTCVAISAARALIAIGKYSHPDKSLKRTPRGLMTIEEWVNSNFESMEGSLTDALFKMLRQCYALGSSTAELVFTNNQKGFGRQWRLKKIKVLSHRRYNYAGFGGEWDRIIYKGSQKDFPIPRRKLLHTYLPDIDSPEDPRGDTPSIRAFPFWKARALAYKSWAMGLKRHATGTWLLKVDSNDSVTKTDKEGNVLRKPDGTIDTEPAVNRHVREVKKAEEGAVIGLPKTVDAQFFGNTSTGGMGQDFNTALMDYKSNILWAYGIPKTLFDEGSGALGQAGLNAGHRIVLDIQSESMVVRLRDQLLEQLIRPLLVANFGIEEQDELGSFTSEEFLPPEMRGTLVSNISQATMQSLLDANDLEVQNAVRKACGISQVSAEQYDQLQLQKLLAAQAEAEQAKAQAEPPPEEAASYEEMPKVARFSRPKVVRRIA